MPASSSIHAPVAARRCGRSRAIVACSVPLARSLAGRFRPSVRARLAPLPAVPDSYDGKRYRPKLTRLAQQPSRKAAIIASLFFPTPARAATWIVALVWMATACILNSRRCGRTHCRYTGPARHSAAAISIRSVSPAASGRPVESAVPEALFVATGNTFGASTWSGGEAVVRPAPDLHRSTDKRDFFPPDWRALDARDADLGGTNPIPLRAETRNGAQDLILALGKRWTRLCSRSPQSRRDRRQPGGRSSILGAEAHVAFQGPGARCPPTAQHNELTVLKIGAPPRLTTAWCGRPCAVPARRSSQRRTDIPIRSSPSDPDPVESRLFSLRARDRLRSIARISACVDGAAGRTRRLRARRSCGGRERDHRR